MRFMPGCGCCDDEPAPCTTARCNSGTTPSTVTITIPDIFNNSAACSECESVAGNYVCSQNESLPCLFQASNSLCNGVNVSAEIAGGGKLSVILDFLNDCSGSPGHDGTRVIWEKSVTYPIDCNDQNTTIPFVSFAQTNVCPAKGAPCSQDGTTAATWVS